MESQLLRWRSGGFSYERELQVNYPKARAFAKAKPTGSEAKINARLDQKTRQFEREAVAAKRGWTNEFFDSLPEAEQVRNIVHDRIANLLEAHAAKVQREVAEEEGKNKSGGGVRDPSYNAFSSG